MTRADRRPSTRRTGSRWTTAAALLALALLQLAMARGVLDRPFLDGRIHFNYDNAFFSVTARNGLRNGDLRSQFGVTLNTYSRWDGPPTSIGYYTDHPFLLKAVFEQVARFAGTGEATSRGFYLAVSFGIAAGFLLLLLEVTGSRLASFVGAATLVLTPLFAVYQTCVKFETDGMLLGVWLLLAVVRWLRHGRARDLRASGVLAGLAVLAHWTSALCLGATAAWLLARAWRHRDDRARRLLVIVVGGGALGLVALAGSMAWLQGGLHSAGRLLAAAASHRAAAATITTAAWLARQRTFAASNFGPVLPWVALAIAAALASRSFLSHRSISSRQPNPDDRPRLLWLIVLAPLTTALVWQVAFRQGSFIHVYWQYWFTLPIAALVAAGIAALRGRRSATLAAAVASAVLLVHLGATARAALAETLRSQLGTPADIELLTAIRGDSFARLAFVPVSEHPLNAWFEGPLFEYYTDRPVAIVGPGQTLRPTDKVLVLRYKDRDAVRGQVEAIAGVRLGHERCGARLCAYDVLQP